jgi:hypothetical protein
MEIERDVCRIQRDVVANERPDALAMPTRQRFETTPEEPVVHQEQVGAECNRAIDRGLAGIDRNGYV